MTCRAGDPRLRIAEAEDAFLAACATELAPTICEMRAVAVKTA